MQTVVQKTKSVRLGNVVFKAGSVNLWLLKDAKVQIEYSIIKIRAHNGVLPARKKPVSVKLSANLYEFYLPNMQYLEGHGVLTNTAASPVSVTGETVATAWWVQGQPFKLANKNGDNTVVSSIVVKRNGSALVVNTDYRPYVGDGINGEKGYTYIVPVSSQSAGTFTADYSYTPNAKRTYTISDLIKAMSYYSFSFENTDENGKKFTITMPNGYSSGNIDFAFPSDDAADEVLNVPFEFTADADGSNRLLIIDDEQSATE